MNHTNAFQSFELDDKYIVTSLITVGGMGEIFAAEMKLTHRKIAIKILHAEFVNQPDMLLRFKMESEIASTLNHPNIVNVFGSGVTSDGKPYLAMEFVEGESLESVLKNQGKIATSQCIDIFLQLARAVEYTHDKGIIHRDIKPSNVMLKSDGKNGYIVKLLDFGIAKTTSVESTIARELTLPGQVFGSVYYMSPEQVLGKAIDFRSDIYSFGCLLFHALAGKPPYVSTVPVDCMQMHIKESIPDLSEYLGEDLYVKALDGIINNCMQKEPSMRFGSASQLRSALEKLSVSAGQQASGAQAESETPAVSAGTAPRFQKKDLLAVISVLIVAALLSSVPFVCNLDLPKAQQERDAKSEASNNMQQSREAALTVSREVDEYILQAESAMKEKDAEQAEQLARKAYFTSLSLAPDDPKIAEALFLLGQIFETRQNYQGALQAYDWTLSFRQAKFGEMAPQTAAVRQRIRETQKLMRSASSTY